MWQHLELCRVKKDVTDKIRRIRETKGFSQQNVADELDIEASSYAKMERGEIEPNLTRLFELAKILEVKVIDFFTEENANPVKEPIDSYGSIGKEDIEKIVLSIQKVFTEINKLRTDLSGKKKPVKKKSEKKS